MQNNVLILDFGSQYTQLIARRVRNLIFIARSTHTITFQKIYPGLRQLSYQEVLFGKGRRCPHPTYPKLKARFPLVRVCYGAQYLAHFNGGNVAPSNIHRIWTRKLNTILDTSNLFIGIPEGLRFGWATAIPLHNFRVKDPVGKYRRCG